IHRWKAVTVPCRSLVAVGGGEDAPRRAVGRPRRAALQEGTQPLLALVARAALRDPARRLRAVGALADEALRPPRGARPGREQLAHDAVDGRVEVVRDLGHEPDAKRGCRVEALAGD